MDQAVPEMTEAEQAAMLQQAQLEQVMRTPVLLAARWAFESVQVQDQPALLMQIQRPTDTIRIVLLRDDALAFASGMRKQATKGPQLVAPASGLLVPQH